MRVASVETTIVSVPYLHREVSSQVARDGVTDILVRVETDDGLVGWGEACSGADAASVEAAVQAMTPFVIGRDPWNREAMQRRSLHARPLAVPRRHRQLRLGRASTWRSADLCGRAAASRCTGCSAGSGAARCRTSTTWRAAATTTSRRSARDGLAQGYETFYLKVGVDDGGRPRDGGGGARGARAGPAAAPRRERHLERARRAPHAPARMAEHDIDFVEQPVRDHPIGQLAEVRARLPMAVCANEGLWSEADAYARIRARQADVYCFSPYWVGSIGAFHRLAHVAHLEGLQVCKHTHGELGLAAAAAPARAADAAEHRRGPPADRARDGGATS